MKYDKNENGLTNLQWATAVILQSTIFMTADFIVHPLSTIWTIQQKSIDGKHPTFFQAAQIARKNRGGLYAGFGAQSVLSVPGTWCYFKGRELSLSIFGDNDFGQTMQGPFGIAFGLLVWSPATTLTMSQQVTGSAATNNVFAHSSLPKKAKYIWQKEGVRGFYRGSLPMFLSSSVTEGFGSWLQARLLATYPEADRKKLAPQFFSTWIAFNFFPFLTSPLDAIFAYLKLAENNPTVFTEKTMRGVAKDIYQRYGWRGFYKGFPGHMLYTSLWYSLLPLKAVMDEHVSEMIVKKGCH